MGRQDMMGMKRTIRRRQLREIVPLADSTIYEMEQRGEFPRRFALSPRCVVWDLGEVEAWLASRKSAPAPRAPHPDVRRRRTRPVKAQDQAGGSASRWNENRKMTGYPCIDYIRPFLHHMPSMNLILGLVVYAA